MTVGAREKVIDKRINHMDDGVGSRKRVFIPGYSGVISRINETIAGTFSQNSRDAHYLVYKGCVPAMDEPTLPHPDQFYSRFVIAPNSHTVCNHHVHNLCPPACTHTPSLPLWPSACGIAVGSGVRR